LQILKIQVRSAHIKTSARDQAVMGRAKRSAERAKKAGNIRRERINLKKRSVKVENVATMEDVKTEPSKREVSARKEEPREYAKLRDHVKKEEPVSFLGVETHITVSKLVVISQSVKVKVKPTAADTKPHVECLLSASKAYTHRFIIRIRNSWSQ
jgi:hypothetical protein